MADTYLYLDRLREAENTIQRASARNLEIPDLLLLRYYIAFLKGDNAGMAASAARAKGKLGAEDWMSQSQALVLARSGQLQRARAISRRASDLAEQALGKVECAPEMHVLPRSKNGEWTYVNSADPREKRR